MPEERTPCGALGTLIRRIGEPIRVLVDPAVERRSFFRA